MCVVWKCFLNTFVRRGTYTLLLKGTIVSFFRNVCFHLLEVTVVLPSLVGLVEGPVLSYRGDGPVLTGVALVCVRLVVRVKSGTFYVDKRHDSASVTSITGGESFSSFVRCLRIDSVFPLCSNCFFYYVYSK